MIHKYVIDGTYIVIDVASGSVHIVDETTYKILDFYKDFSFEQICEKLNDINRDELLEAYNEIKILVENGIMFSRDEYKELVPTVNARNPVVKALCLHIAHDCNLACQYCFADEGEYNGPRSLMSREVGLRAIDFIIENSGKRRNLEIDFFGGEPTLNFQVVKDIVDYGRKREKESGKNFRFTLTTNGILLNDEMITYINETMDNVVLSIDGRKEINDKMRPKSGGQGTYDTIVPKFQKLAESRKQDKYYVRGTFTRNNLDFSKDVLHLADLGFKQISVEPVVGDEQEPYTIKREDLETIYAEYINLAREIKKRADNGQWFNFFHFMIDLTGGPCVSKRLVGCGAGTEYLAVTPEGDLYPCHQFTGQDEFKMGDVYNGVLNQAKRKEFEDCNVYSKEECSSCWARFYCSGGCASNAHSENGDILKPYDIGCELQKKRVECAIWLKALEV